MSLSGTGRTESNGEKGPEENSSTNPKRAPYESVDELAAELGLNRAGTYKGLRDGTIPSIRLGKRFVIPKAAISKWLESAGSTVA